MDEYIEKDKTNAPFLLASSFAGLVTYLGSYSQNGILYWKFSPKDKALILIDQLRTKTAPHIQAQDLFQAINFFWKQVAEIRNGENQYGSIKK